MHILRDITCEYRKATLQRCSRLYRFASTNFGAQISFFTRFSTESVLARWYVANSAGFEPETSEMATPQHENRRTSFLIQVPKLTTTN